ncbi:hypothetical protein H6P81_007779 [Aristolochia fimbriata]|uniref:Uncharacterized protein n=1 Tax=Aristolochia fimbriata TaxID=158543 RepID=A0AAV7F173_ARIFI|nr:hypothetical protein H6P81_007779 [Aristolochia fimbriata]
MTSGPPEEYEAPGATDFRKAVEILWRNSLGADFSTASSIKPAGHRASCSMEWYFSEEEHQGSVPIYEEKRDPFYVNDESPLSEDWLQWGVLADEILFCFGGQGVDIESPQASATHDCSSLVDFSAGKSNSYLPDCGFVSDQPDYQLQNLSQSSSAQMDDNFLCSFFENENQFTEVIVDSKTASTCTESISTKDDELLDPNDMALDNWATEYGTLCWTPESSAQLGGSTTSKAPTILSQEQLNVSCKASITTGEESSSVTAAIQDLEAATRQLTPETRICFRDAFYRLAGSLKQRQLVNERGSMMTDEGSTGWARADVIDKIVADLLLERISSNLHQ